MKIVLNAESRTFVVRNTVKNIQLQQVGRRGATGQGVPAGGTVGQVLAKNSDTDYDTEWVVPPSAPVSSVNGGTGAVILTQDDVADGTTYKQYSLTEKTKLSGIEANADVTDATNVASAGAFMKSVDDTDDITESATKKFLTDGDKGDITVSSSGSVWTIDNQAVTRSKLEHIQTGHFLGRHASGTGDVQEVSPAQLRTIINVEDGAEVNNISDANATDLTDGGVTTLHSHTVTKSDVGLGNVDNTSDATKNSATVTLTNKTINFTDNTVTTTKAELNTAVSDGDVMFVGDDITQSINARVDSYTLVTADIGKLVTLNKATAVDLTIDSSLGMTAGQRIDVAQLGVGQVTIVASSTTVNATPTLKLRTQYSACTIVCLSTNNYLVIGDMASV